ncbi:hypothetical protein MJO29_011600 [Puccinia striiformis f. sp. tritici]|nr:hypothetical protein MJO29_011600 [Puccinia striiformis f. sp. tritici]
MWLRNSCILMLLPVHGLSTDAPDGMLRWTHVASRPAELVQRTDQEGFEVQAYWLPGSHRRGGNPIFRQIHDLRSQQNGSSDVGQNMHGAHPKKTRWARKTVFRFLSKIFHPICRPGQRASSELAEQALGPVISFEERYAELLESDERLELVQQAVHHILLSLSMSRTEAVAWITTFTRLLAHYRGPHKLPTSLVYGLHSLLLKHMSDPTLASSIRSLLLHTLTAISPHVRRLLIGEWSQEMFNPRLGLSEPFRDLQKFSNIVRDEPTLGSLLLQLPSKRPDVILGRLSDIVKIFSARAPGCFSSQTRVVSIAVLFHLIEIGVPEISQQAVAMSKALLMNRDEYLLLGHERALLDTILSDSYEQAKLRREQLMPVVDSKGAIHSEQAFLRTGQKDVWSKPYWFPKFDPFGEQSLVEQMNDLRSSDSIRSGIATCSAKSVRPWGRQLSPSASALPLELIPSKESVKLLEFFQERYQDLHKSGRSDQALKLVQSALLHVLQTPALPQIELDGWLTQLELLAMTTPYDLELLTTIVYGLYSIRLKISDHHKPENSVGLSLDHIIASIPMLTLEELGGEWSRGQSSPSCYRRWLLLYSQLRTNPRSNNNELIELFNPIRGLSPRFREWKQVNKILVNESTLEGLRMCLQHDEHAHIEQHMSSMERIFRSQDSPSFSAQTRIASIVLLAHLIAIPNLRLAAAPLEFSMGLVTQSEILFPHERLLLGTILKEHGRFSPS